MTRRSFVLGAIGVGARGAGSGLGTIAYIQDDGLWVCGLPEPPRRLVSGDGLNTPRISPSGKWISYMAGQTVHVIAASGGAGQRLAKSGQWVPGRDELLVEGSNGLIQVGAADHWRRPLREYKGAALPVVFSPRGDAMVYADSTQRIGHLWRAALEGESESKLLATKMDGGLIPCGWSGNDAVLYWEDPEFSASVMADGLPLYRVAAAGGLARPLGVTTLVHEDAIAWSPGRDRLAVSAGGGRNQWEEKRIATIDMQTFGISWVTDKGVSAVNPAWSPDGREIAYSAAPSVTLGGGEGARRALAQRRIWCGGRQLTRSSAYRDEAPMWSADGGHILFFRMAGDNARSLWLMRADGSEARPVAGPLEGEGSWFGYYGWVDWHGMFDWLR
jgi:dipeptidyl aminopeptidase/acylaminoacyl peptidase